MSRHVQVSIQGSNIRVPFTVRKPAATAAEIRRHFRKEDPKTGRCRIKAPLTLVLEMGGKTQVVALTGSHDHQEDMIARAIMSMNGAGFKPESLTAIEVGDIGEMRA